MTVHSFEIAISLTRERSRVRFLPGAFARFEIFVSLREHIRWERNHFVIDDAHLRMCSCSSVLCMTNIRNKMEKLTNGRLDRELVFDDECREFASEREPRAFEGSLSTRNDKIDSGKKFTGMLQTNETMETKSFVSRHIQH